MTSDFYSIPLVIKLLVATFQTFFLLLDDIESLQEKSMCKLIALASHHMEATQWLGPVKRISQLHAYILYT